MVSQTCYNVLQLHRKSNYTQLKLCYANSIKINFVASLIEFVLSSFSLAYEEKRKNISSPLIFHIYSFQSVENIRI